MCSLLRWADAPRAQLGFFSAEQLGADVAYVHSLVAGRFQASGAVASQAAYTPAAAAAFAAYPAGAAAARLLYPPSHALLLPPALGPAAALAGGGGGGGDDIMPAAFAPRRFTGARAHWRRCEDVQLRAVVAAFGRSWDLAIRPAVEAHGSSFGALRRHLGARKSKCLRKRFDVLMAFDARGEEPQYRVEQA
jgi:hypothetical protein